MYAAFEYYKYCKPKEILLSKKNLDTFISVLIPGRDEEENIGQCIASILNQDHRFFELIVLNDNLIDKTVEILKSFNDLEKVLSGRADNMKNHL